MPALIEIPSLPQCLAYLGLAEAVRRCRPQNFLDQGRIGAARRAACCGAPGPCRAGGCARSGLAGRSRCCFSPPRTASSPTARRCDRGSGVRRQRCRGISDRLHRRAVACGIGFAAYFLDLPFQFRRCRFRHWSHILLPPPHVGCCRPPTIRGKARVHLMRKAPILERLTIAILGH